MKEVLILFGIPTIPYLIFFIYAMRTIAKDKKTASAGHSLDKKAPSDSVTTLA
jgi:hypothetical protein